MQLNTSHLEIPTWHLSLGLKITKPNLTHRSFINSKYLLNQFLHKQMCYLLSNQLLKTDIKCSKAFKR